MQGPACGDPEWHRSGRKDPFDRTAIGAAGLSFDKR